MATVKHQTYDGNGNLVSEEDVEVPAEVSNRDGIEAAARGALAANRAFVASTPTTAQATAQVKALSRQVNGIIRLLLGQLDGTD
jgi:hypothetical protein